MADAEQHRITYCFDPDTQILETNLYQGDKLILRQVVMPPKSLDAMKVIHGIKAKKEGRQSET